MIKPTTLKESWRPAVVFASLTGPLWPVVGAALLASIGYIELVNKYGGSNGVDINGVIGTEGLIVTPRVGKIYADLIQAARMAVSGRTIIDFLVIASGDVPALGTTLGIPVVASVLTAIESGSPLGWALAGALGLVVNLKESAPDPNQHGHIWANRDTAAQWESFILAQLGTGNKVSLLSWQQSIAALLAGPLFRSGWRRKRCLRQPTSGGRLGNLDADRQ